MKISFKALEKLLSKEGYGIFTGGVIADKGGLYLLCEVKDHSLKLELNQFQLDKGNLDYEEKLVGLMNLFDREKVGYSKNFSGEELKNYILYGEEKRELRVKGILKKINKLK